MPYESAKDPVEDTFKLCVDLEFDKTKKSIMLIIQVMYKKFQSGNVAKTDVKLSEKEGIVLVNNCIHLLINIFELYSCSCSIL